MARSSDLSARGPDSFLIEDPNLHFKLTHPGASGVHSVSIVRHAPNLFAINCYGQRKPGDAHPPLVSYAFGVAETNLLAVVAGLVS